MSQNESSKMASSKGMFWTGVAISALPTLTLLASAIAKLAMTPKPEDLAPIGWEVSKIVPLAVIELACTVLYIFPRTAVLGAILLTGYMGGAIATHVRVGEMFVIQALIGVLLWLGLYLRDARLRQLIPLRA